MQVLADHPATVLVPEKVDCLRSPEASLYHAELLPVQLLW